jgi:hypothetical protein
MNAVAGCSERLPGTLRDELVRHHDEAARRVQRSCAIAVDVASRAGAASHALMRYHTQRVVRLAQPPNPALDLY